ncbi:E3 ubiquitin-protein ligase XIAP isoform X2 [Triplophysa rosa]|uniref:E3 ubiquitin-protein ligase XIAP isoform X2 n=1 Tax=Triplophysa rosa TaxID=992332 RepID=UPI002545EE10|nr:E3 ubiquitin-protein ligase XIAP isoform X2 [Triplophysa rosa]
MAQSSDDGRLETDDAGLSVMDARLHSFQHFPRSQVVSAKRMARAGFYYTGEADKVRCFSCRATVEDWNEGDVPLRRHQQASPACTFLNCTHGLSALHNGSDYDEEAEAMAFQLRTGEVMDESVYPKVPHMKSEEARMGTFSNWPANSPVQPSDLAEAGMYYLEREDHVQCFCCGGMLAEWQQGDNPWSEHEKYSPNCFFILGHDVGNVPLATQSRRVNGREGSLETFEGRLDTFRSTQHPIEHERLARAGFYSTGERDKVICFKCGGGVKDWLPDEDPWEEHAKYYPGCSFLLAEKGNEYVSQVQLRRPNGHHSRSSQNGFSSHEEAAQKVMQSEIGKKAVEMGFDPTKVESTLLQKLRQVSRGYTSVEALIQDIAEQQSDLDVPEKPDDPMTKLEKLQREKLCKVCMDNDINIVFIPCAHLATCQKCSESLPKCPICCVTIVQKIKTYNA